MSERVIPYYKCPCGGTFTSINYHNHKTTIKHNKFKVANPDFIMHESWDRFDQWAVKLTDEEKEINKNSRKKYPPKICDICKITTTTNYIYKHMKMCHSNSN